MNYIIKAECIDKNNSYNLSPNDIAYIGDVFGKELTKNKNNAYQFISEIRANSLKNKLENTSQFKCDVIKKY